MLIRVWQPFIRSVSQMETVPLNLTTESPTTQVRVPAFIAAIREDGVLISRTVVPIPISSPVDASAVPLPAHAVPATPGVQVQVQRQQQQPNYGVEQQQQQQPTTFVVEHPAFAVPQPARVAPIVIQQVPVTTYYEEPASPAVTNYGSSQQAANVGSPSPGVVAARIPTGNSNAGSSAPVNNYGSSPPTSSYDVGPPPPAPPVTSYETQPVDTYAPADSYDAGSVTASQPPTGTYNVEPPSPPVRNYGSPQPASPPTNGYNAVSSAPVNNYGSSPPRNSYDVGPPPPAPPVTGYETQPTPTSLPADEDSYGPPASTQFEDYDNTYYDYDIRSDDPTNYEYQDVYGGPAGVKRVRF